LLVYHPWRNPRFCGARRGKTSTWYTPLTPRVCHDHA
jgi:hypothetical protein